MSSGRNRAPFRAEHIGSLLRPPELRQAYELRAAGTMHDAEFRAVEDRHICDAIRFQEDIGLHSITDGEFRRTVYFGHFTRAVSGFRDMEAALPFRDANGMPLTYLTPVVSGRLRRERGIATDEFLFVKAHTKETPKATLPSPCSQHYFRWREGVSEAAYPDIEQFYADVAGIYREELRALGEAGCSNVQLDAVSLPLLCDPALRGQVQERGYDPTALVDRYIELNNAALAERPAGMRVGMHLCRGNNQGRWLGEGGYDWLAEEIFTRLDIDYFCLEYDSPRAGSFAPLRFMPKDKLVVLGLVSSKTPQLESADDLRRRLDEAARHVPMERLCLSPQCGFASNAPGNPLTEADQRRKLELVVSVADSAWNDA
jgi:5-methyltetrahydropteroyltriglutamate--homocysteine methyltransferase